MECSSLILSVNTQLPPECLVIQVNTISRLTKGIFTLSYFTISKCQGNVTSFSVLELLQRLHGEICLIWIGVLLVCRKMQGPHKSCALRARTCKQVIKYQVQKLLQIFRKSCRRPGGVPSVKKEILKACLFLRWPVEVE